MTTRPSSPSWRRTAITSSLLLAAATIVIGGGGIAASATAGHAGPDHHPAPKLVWANTWMAAVTHGDSAGSTNAGLNNQSVRLIVHTTVSGGAVRIRISDQHGDQAITVGHATVAKPNTSTASEADIVPSTLRELKFDGAASTVIHQGATVLSDPVPLPVGSQQDLVVSIFFPTPTGPTTFHSTSRQTNFVGPTDLADQTDGTGYTTTRTCCWFFLSGVDVLRPATAGPVVVFGDSLGDSNGSTLDANTRWPNLLYARLNRTWGPAAPAVLNASLAGNRLNHEGTEPGAGGFPGYAELGTNALARLDTDVYAETHVQTVITDLGINDIWMSDDSSAAIIATLRQLNQQLQEKGIRSVVATLGPYKGMLPAETWTPEKEATRQAVNAWIRSQHEFNGVVDFDQVLRDPADPAQLNPTLDSGDHIHPNDLGNQRMADAVSLGLLRR